MPERDLSEVMKEIRRSVIGHEGHAMSDINKKYAEGLDELRNVIRKKFDEYAVDGKLTYEKMVKYDRVKKLDKELAKAVKSMHVEVSKLTRAELRDIYRQTFDKTRSAFEQAAGRTIRGKIKQKVVTEALQMPVSGLTLNDRLRKRRRSIIDDIQETIGQGLYHGESYSEMSQRLKESLEGDTVKARRIVRTESHRVMEKSKADTAEYASNQGVEMKKYWSPADDERVRGKPGGKYEDARANHSGKGGMGDKYSKENAIPVDENFVNDETGGEGPAPGQLGVAEDDINCRCVAVYIVVTED